MCKIQQLCYPQTAHLERKIGTFQAAMEQQKERSRAALREQQAIFVYLTINHTKAMQKSYKNHTQIIKNHTNIIKKLILRIGYHIGFAWLFDTPLCWWMRQFWKIMLWFDFTGTPWFEEFNSRGSKNLQQSFYANHVGVPGARTRAAAFAIGCWTNSHLTSLDSHLPGDEMINNFHQKPSMWINQHISSYINITNFLFKHLASGSTYWPQLFKRFQQMLRRFRRCHWQGLAQRSEDPSHRHLVKQLEDQQELIQYELVTSQFKSH